MQPVVTINDDNKGPKRRSNLIAVPVDHAQLYNQAAWCPSRLRASLWPMTTRSIAKDPVGAVLAEVSLRPLHHGDAVRVRQWMRDPEVIHNTVVVPEADYGDVEPYDTAMADDYLRSLVEDPDRRSFAILWWGEHVGNVGLKAYVPGTPSCECFVELGESRARSRGVATRAMELILALAFNQLQLQEVRLGVFAFNERAIRLYQRLGFVHTHVLGLHYVNGRAHEVLGMALQAVAWPPDG
jgi:RimJ/RimL family protein N-acetyltransferase